MKRVKRRPGVVKYFGVLAGLAMAFSVLPAVASAPAVAVRLAPLAQWQQDVQFLAEMLEGKDGVDKLQALAGVLEALGKNGFDANRPIGVVCQVGKQGQPVLVGCVPFSNLDQLHALAKSWISEPTQISDNVYQVKIEDRDVYVRLQNDWILVSHNSEALESTPEDPGAWFAGLSESAELCVSIDPQELRQLEKGTIKNWLKEHDALPKSVARIVQSQELRQAIIQPLWETFNEAMSQTEKVTLNYQIDRTGKKLLGSCTWSAQAGSDLASHFAQQRFLTSPLVAVRRWNDAALTMGWCVTFPSPSEEDLRNLGELIQTRWHNQIERRVSNQMDADLLKSLADDLLRLAGDWVRQGKTEGVVALVNRPDQVTLLMGGYVADSSGLETWVGNLIESARQRVPEAFERVTIIPDYSVHGDASIHVMRIAMKDKFSPEQAAVLGEDIEIAFTAVNGYAAVAIGKNAVGTIKRAIDDALSFGDQTAPAFEFSVKLDDFVAALAKVNPQDSHLQQLKTNLEQCEGVQFLRKKVEFTNQQMVVTFEADLNLLRLPKN